MGVCKVKSALVKHRVVVTEENTGPLNLAWKKTFNEKAESSL